MQREEEKIEYAWIYKAGDNNNINKFQYCGFRKKGGEECNHHNDVSRTNDINLDT